MERYPREWKDSALELLRAIREETRISLGYKRLGWEPIRLRILSGKDDTRLIRQNLEDWEETGSISDEKFALVDSFLREAASQRADSRAVELVSDWRFRRLAESLRSMYVARGRSAEICKNMRPFPWSLYFEPGDGAWYKSLFIRALRVHLGITQVVIGYLPKTLYRTKLDDGLDTVFYEGFVIPLGPQIDGFREESHIAAIKLTRQEFRGMQDVGLADGYLDYIPMDENVEQPRADGDVFMYRSSSLLSPHRGPVDITFQDQQYEIYSERAENVDIIIDQMIKTYHRGYVF